MGLSKWLTLTKIVLVSPGTASRSSSAPRCSLPVPFFHFLQEPRADEDEMLHVAPLLKFSFNAATDP